jgi:VWFA-related protein
MRRPLVLLAGVLLATTGSPLAERLIDSASGDIPVRIVVSDPKGRHVTGLSAADVEVYEGARQHSVRTFAAVDKGARTFGILLDDYHVSSAASERVVASILDFVDQKIRPDDIVLVMRPLDSASAIAPIAAREKLRAVISRFVGRKGHYVPANAFEAEYLSAAPPAAARQRAQIARAAMQALATAMSRLPVDTPKAMVVVTEGFVTEDRGRERLATLRTVARAARLANVSVYVVDPSPVAREQLPFGEQWNLLATQTGGVLTSQGLPMAPALAQVAADLDGSYQLTIPRPEKEDGAHHALEIRVKRKDAVVRAPSGYWAPLAAERLTPPSRPAMSTYLKTPHVSGLIQPWFRMTRAGSGRTRVTFSWAPKAGRTPGVSVAFSAITFEGKKVSDGEVRTQGAAAGTTRAVFEAAPGPIQISMAIRDAAGKLLDTDVQYIDVPSLETSGALIAAVDVVRTRTLREFLARQLDADILPADTRDFDRHDRLIVRVRAYSPMDDAPRVTARLLNPLGHPMRELTPLPDIDGIPQFDLPLSNYARGDYRIEIRATAGASSVSQLVMFRLIG